MEYCLQIAQEGYLLVGDTEFDPNWKKIDAMSR